MNERTTEQLYKGSGSAKADLYNDPAPIRPRCPECEGSGTIDVSYTWEPENVTCPKCEGCGTVCWAEYLADLASDEIDEACNQGELYLAEVGA